MTTEKHSDFRIEFSIEDNCWVCNATVPGWPNQSVNVHGNSPKEALEESTIAVSLAVEVLSKMMRNNG